VLHRPLARFEGLLCGDGGREIKEWEGMALADNFSDNSYSGRRKLNILDVNLNVLRIGPNLITASALDSMLSSPKVKVR